MAVYTLGVWTVKPGHEDDFIEAWNALATATVDDFPAQPPFSCETATSHRSSSRQGHGTRSSRSKRGVHRTHSETAWARSASSSKASRHTRWTPSS